MNRFPGTLACLAAVAVVPIAANARAEEARSTVAIVRVGSSDRLLREASIRLHAELEDSGFQVVDVDRVPGDSRAEVEEGAADGASFATIAMNRVGAGAAADVWISDHVTGKTVVRRLRVGEAGNPAAVLAIRALELLRASLLEVAAREHRSGPKLAAPPDVMKWVEPALPERASPPPPLFRGGTLGVGAVGAHGLRGIGAAVGPTVRASYGIGSEWLVRLNLAGPLLGPEVSAPAGSATVRQEYASLELGWASAPRPLGVLAWIGAGAFDLQASGSAVPPYHSTSGGVLSFLSTTGVGGTLRLGSRLAFIADLAALVAFPRPYVSIGGRDAGSAAMPSLALSLGLVVGL
jgi:hypothetical protein